MNIEELKDIEYFDGYHDSVRKPNIDEIVIKINEIINKLNDN